MKINKHQIEAIIHLPCSERYLHFISTIVDWENLYIVAKQNTIYVFPAIEYAHLFAEMKQIDLKMICQKSLDEFIQYISAKEIIINVFPTPFDELCLIAKEKLIQDIEEEIEKY